MSEAAQPSDIAVGTLVAGTYEVVRQLGRGGMGAVWEAHHTRLPGKKVAIKVLHAEVAGDPESTARFRREAEITSRLGHPNIVEVHDFNSLPSGAPYLVLEFLEGESLGARLARGPLPTDEVISLARQIASALHAAHREEIVHRDLKPQNVFLARAGDGSEAAKVLDFGISKIRGSQTIKTQESSMLGTPQYMAPEQASGNHAAVDARTDVFALGAMVYEMLCGSPAFPGQNIPEVVFKVVYQDPDPLSQKAPSLPSHMADAVHRALAKNRDDRFAHVSAFVEALTGSPLTTAPRRQRGVGARAPGHEDALAATAAGSQPPSPLGTDETIAPAPYPAVDSDEPLEGERAFAAADREAPPALGRSPVAGTDETMAADTDAAPAPPSASASSLTANATRASDPRDRPTKALKTPMIALLGAGLGAALVAALVTQPWAGSDAESALAAAPKDAALLRERGGAARDAAAPSRETEDHAAKRKASPGRGAADEGGASAASSGETTRDESAPDSGDRSPEERASARSDETSRQSTSPPEPPDQPAVSKEIEGELDAASRALRAGNPDEAIRLVERAELREATGRGFSIKARAYCAKRELSNARANWRNLSAGARKRVARFCEDYDIQL